MARDVAITLKKLVATKLNLNEEQVEDYFFQLKVWELGWGPQEGSRPRSHAFGTRTRAADLGWGSALRPPAPLQKPGAGWAPGACGLSIPQWLPAS